MDILNLQEWMTHFEKKLFLFFIVFLSTCGKTPFVFCLPICCLAFVLGKHEFLVSLLGLSLGCLLGNNVRVLLYVCLFIHLLLTFIPFYSIKTRTISYIGFVYSLVIHIGMMKTPINQGIMQSVILFYLMHLLLQYSSLFVHTKETYRYDELYSDPPDALRSRGAEKVWPHFTETDPRTSEYPQFEIFEQLRKGLRDFVGHSL